MKSRIHSVSMSCIFFLFLQNAVAIFYKNAKILAQISWVQFSKIHYGIYTRCKQACHKSQRGCLAILFHSKMRCSACNDGKYRCRSLTAYHNQNACTLIPTKSLSLNNQV
uniref:Putative secreted protein salivary gland overexpressed n=1 Tax=Rhipicephalus microplus TaxID=6941 RepID=A0A6M2D9L2_RHIMP